MLLKIKSCYILTFHRLSEWISTPDKRTLKRVQLIFSGLSIVVAFVVADYFEIFGTEVEKKLSFAEIRFRTVNEETNNLIMDVGVRCFQKNNMNACTRRESHQLGVVAVHIPIQRAVKRTIIFTKAEQIYKTIDPKIHIMFIHKDYHRLTETILMADVYSNKVTERIVKMSPEA